MNQPRRILKKLKDWILERYGSSSFNNCNEQPLLLVCLSTPLELFINPKAWPIITHREAPVPFHFQDEVKKGLDRDVRLGILEKVPLNDPVTWCSHMLVLQK